MILQASGTADRRTAPRLQTSFTAELASGTVLVPVMVRDLSTAGCGVVIIGGDPDLPDRLGGYGLLHVPAGHHGIPGGILPVALRSVRSEDRHVIYGLQFGPLLDHQERKLHGVLEAVRGMI